MEYTFQFSYPAVRRVVHEALSEIMFNAAAEPVYEHVMGLLRISS